MRLLTDLYRRQRSVPGWFRVAQLLSIVVIVWGVVGLATVGVGRIFDGGQSDDQQSPALASLQLWDLELPLVGAREPKPAIERLMAAAERLSTKTMVPYVFGGGRIGTPEQCQACISCARRLKLPAESSLARFNRCGDCRKCGVDCSNFVNLLFAEAGLRFKFATTRTLNSLGQDFLKDQLGFVNVGQDLEVARPGDLVIEKGHVVMVIAVDTKLRTIDYIHSSRGSRGRKPIGGIELRRGKSLDALQKKTLRILRHVELITPDEEGISLGMVPRAVRLWQNLLATNN